MKPRNFMHFIFSFWFQILMQIFLLSCFHALMTHMFVCDRCGLQYIERGLILSCWNKQGHPVSSNSGSCWSLGQHGQVTSPPKGYHRQPLVFTCTPTDNLESAADLCVSVSCRTNPEMLKLRTERPKPNQRIWTLNLLAVGNSSNHRDSHYFRNNQLHVCPRKRKDELFLNGMFVFFFAWYCFKCLNALVPEPMQWLSFQNCVYFVKSYMLNHVKCSLGVQRAQHCQKGRV